MRDGERPEGSNGSVQHPGWLRHLITSPPLNCHGQPHHPQPPRENIYLARAKGGGAGGSRASRVLRCYVHLHHVTLDVKTRRLHGVRYPCIASLALAPKEDVDDGHTLLYPLTYTKTLLS